MPVTMSQVLAELDKDEPMYPKLAKLGAGALPHLQMIVDAEDPLRAAKAAYAASLIGGAAGVEVLRHAADHPDAQVRIAVADGLRHLDKEAPADLVLKALDDADAGVRKLALSTAGALNRPEFAARVAEIAKDDPAEHLRSAAASATKAMRAPAPASAPASAPAPAPAKKAPR